MNNPLSRKLIPSIYPLTPKFAANYAKKPAKSVFFFGISRGSGEEIVPNHCHKGSCCQPFGKPMALTSMEG